MTALEHAILAHIHTAAWVDHPAASVRRRRQSVAQLLGLTSGEAGAAARRLAREQRDRGVKTVDTAKLPGSLGAAPGGAS